MSPMLYFAYGSLVNREQLRELCPAAKPVNTAKVPHHFLCFTGHSDHWGGGTATIGLAPAADLWGGLYEIDAAGRREIERSGEADGYVWAFTDVQNSHGELIRSGLLVKVRDLTPSVPSDRYLDVLKAGWVQWGLDPDDMLRNIPSTL